MKLAAHEIAAFLGKRGSGKSNRAKDLCGELLRAGQRVVVFDYHDEYSQLGRTTKQTRLGPLTSRVTIAELEEDEGMLDEEKLSLAVVPSTKDRRAAADDFETLAMLVKSTGGMVFVADELGAWGEYAEETLNDLACQSRHEDIPLVWVAQRAMQIPMTARSQVTRVNTGIQTNPRDLEVLGEIFGDRELAARVPRLERGDSLDWRDTQRPKKAKEKTR